MRNQFHSILNSVFALALLVITATACGGQTEPSIYGKWQGVYDKNNATIIFGRDGTINFSTMGVEYTGTFNLDQTTSPMKLDMIYTDLGHVQTILEFVDKNTIRIENSLTGDPRPTVFSSDFITLTRQ
jgi:hypothetical protein